MSWRCPICNNEYMGNSPYRCCGKFLKIDVNNSVKYPCTSEYAGKWEFIKVLVCEDQQTSAINFRC